MYISRRNFLKAGTFVCLSSMLGCSAKHLNLGGGRETEYEVIPVEYTPHQAYFSGGKPVVSIVRINEKWSQPKGIEYAVTEAVDLIGGVDEIAKGKERILLKPNLVSHAPTDTTKVQVSEALARLMKNSGREVYIGEASAAAMKNIDMNIQGYVCRTKDAEFLEAIQNQVFDNLGYSDLSKKIDVPLINLHVGKMAKMNIPDNFVFKEIYIHKALSDADLICSVPIMKTHGLAGVTLALKNVGIGAYPGLVYGTVRSEVHTKATQLEQTGTSTAIVDMVKANKIGLTVIDASTAMQGQGPSVTGGGELVEMNLIIASTNALAADIVAANVMGFKSIEIDTFLWAWKAGMTPSAIDKIDIVGESLADVQKHFKRPRVIPYTAIKDWYGPPCNTPPA